MKKKIYIAGPMTGLPDFNKPAFHSKAQELEQEGFTVLNPAVLPDGLEHHEYMQICIPMVIVSDEIYMLEGWEQSKGVRMEHEHALDMGLSVTYQC